jgi:hypothetical protein
MFAQLMIMPTQKGEEVGLVPQLVARVAEELGQADGATSGVDARETLERRVGGGGDAVAGNLAEAFVGETVERRRASGRRRWLRA